MCDNFVIIAIFTLKGISSEVGCHVESADCHLAVPVSRKNLPLPLSLSPFFSLRVVHQQHHHTKDLTSLDFEF